MYTIHKEAQACLLAENTRKPDCGIETTYHSATVTHVELKMSRRLTAAD